MSDSYIIAAGLNGFYAVSKDGKKWLQTTGVEGETAVLVGFGNYSAVKLTRSGSKGKLAITRDGKAWKEQSIEMGYGGGPKGFCYYKGLYYLSYGEGTNVNKGSASLSRSKDGLSWSPQKNISGSKILRRFATDGETIVGVGDFGRKSYSSNGASWNDSNDNNPKHALLDVVYGNGVYVGSGLHGMRMVSIDGKTWSEPLFGEEGEHINKMIFDGEQFVGVGLGGTYLSKNGNSWKRVKNNQAPYLVSYVNGMYVGIKWKGRVYLSEDGIDWSQSANLKGAITCLNSGVLA